MADYINSSCEPFRAWNRLEGRPRKTEFDSVLGAEIHDALWMLTRQWQFGEFKGEDTGSAVFAKVKLETTRVTRFRNSEGTAVSFDESIPLEARVERMPVKYDYRFRARAGQHWAKMVAVAAEDYNTTNGWTAGDPNYMDAAAYRSLFASIYTFGLPTIDRVNDSTDLQVAKARLLSNQQAHQALTALDGRTADGVEWLQALKAIGNPPASLPITVTGHSDYNAAHEATLLATAASYMDWFASTHEAPTSDADMSWTPSSLEYQFAVSLPNHDGEPNTVLEATDYYQGRLDWFAFDHALNDDGTGLVASDAGEDSAKTTQIFTMIPAEARFGGMPNSRWWELEDGYMDLGNINAETTNIAKVLLAEFALMYSNDWFVIPYPVPAGSLSEVKGIIVTDTFGVKTLVEAAGQGDSNDWTAWTMFNLTRNSASEELAGKVDPRILVPQAVTKVEESKPIEQVQVVRDEQANLVWGVETLVPDLLGGGRDGHKAATDLTNYLRDLERGEEDETALEIPEGVKLKYVLGNTVPENWIPFMPIQLPDGSNRAIQLQRASMPRWFNGDFKPVRPMTSILREGMSEDETNEVMPFVNEDDEVQNSPYFLNEEEAPRGGVTVESSWQRTRWYDGRTVVWYGRRKMTGRGEASSGLVFDTVSDVDYIDQEALVPASS
jgi:hypothetical protein